MEFTFNDRIASVFPVPPPPASRRSVRGDDTSGRARVLVALAYVVTATLMAQTVFPPARRSRSRTHLVRLHGAVAAGDAGRPGNRHERHDRQAVGGVQQLRRRAGARAARRLRHRRERRRPPNQESLELVERDFDGKVLWSYSHTWRPRDGRRWGRASTTTGSARIPGRLLLAGEHSEPAEQRPDAAADARDAHQAGGGRRRDRGRRLIEVSRTGEVLWEWVASDHIDEFKFSPEARKVIKADPRRTAGQGAGRRRSTGST